MTVSWFQLFPFHCNKFFLEFFYCHQIWDLEIVINSCICIFDFCLYHLCHWVIPVTVTLSGSAFVSCFSSTLLNGQSCNAFVSSCSNIQPNAPLPLKLRLSCTKNKIHHWQTLNILLPHFPCSCSIVMKQVLTMFVLSPFPPQDQFPTSSATYEVSI